MTVRDLRAILKGLPPGMQVKIHDDHDTGPCEADAMIEFDYVIVAASSRIKTWRKEAAPEESDV